MRLHVFSGGIDGNGERCDREMIMPSLMLTSDMFVLSEPRVRYTVSRAWSMPSAMNAQPSSWFRLTGFLMPCNLPYESISCSNNAIRKSTLDGLYVSRNRFM